MSGGGIAAPKEPLSGEGAQPTVPTPARSTRIVCHCDEAYLPSEFTFLDGWWATPLPDIVFCNGRSGETCEPVFTQTAPEPVGARRCPLGCLWRTLPEPNDQENW